MDALNRAYIGLRLPAVFHPKIAEVQVAVRHKAGSDVVRWISPPEIQITLMALGEVSLQNMEQIRRMIGPMFALFQPFTISIEGLIGQPSALQPRFIAMAVTGDTDQMIAIHNQLERGLIPLLREYTAKPFVPHMDLGRIKIESEQNRTALGRAIRMSQIGCLATFDVPAIELLRNVTSSAGPALELIESYALGA